MTTRRALILLSWLMLLSASALGQSSKAIPRLNDGKPDMQGYWTNQTFTPLERPAQYKGKEYFTAEEAESFAKRALDDVRDVPRGEQVKSDADIHYDDGIWLLEGYKKGAMLRTSIITDPMDGRIPPLNAEGQKRAQARAEARKLIGAFDSAQARSLSERCLYWAHEGPPLFRLVTTPISWSCRPRRALDWSKAACSPSASTRCTRLASWSTGSKMMDGD